MLVRASMNKKKSETELSSNIKDKTVDNSGADLLMAPEMGVDDDFKAGAGGKESGVGIHSIE